MRFIRRMGAAILLALVVHGSTVADSGLTALVNATWLTRTSDAVMHEIAHQRAVEIASDWSHNGQRPGTAEVLAYNQGFADPISKAIEQWAGSPTHAAILSDPQWTRIGCAEYVTGNISWFACVLAAPTSPPAVSPVGPGPEVTPAPRSGAEPASGPAPTSPPVLLPNTATEEP